MSQCHTISNDVPPQKKMLFLKSLILINAAEEGDVIQTMENYILSIQAVAIRRN